MAAISEQRAEDYRALLFRFLYQSSLKQLNLDGNGALQKALRYLWALRDTW